MIENTSKSSMYLESGECKPGELCEVTNREATMLKRQGYKEVTKKKPSENIHPFHEDEIPTDPDRDEFGPLKGTENWFKLSPNEKMVITRKRNMKYGPA